MNQAFFVGGWRHPVPPLRIVPIDAAQGGEIDDGTPAKPLPNVGNYQDPAEIVGVGHKVNRFATKGADDGVDGPVEREDLLKD